jgi:hypothetical protein
VARSLERSTAAIAYPLRLVRGSLFAVFTRVTAGALLGLLLMMLASTLLSRGLGAGAVARTGAFSAGAILLIVGVIGGSLVGVTLAVDRILALVTREARDLFARLPVPLQDKLFPTMPLDDLRGRYDGVVQRAFDESIGRVPMPGFIRRFIRARFGPELVQDFMAECDRSATTTVKFPQLRDWMLARGIPYALAPLSMQARMWRIGVGAVMVLLFILAAGSGVLLS